MKQTARPGTIAAFDAWLTMARRRAVRVLESFAASLEQDGATVRAGLRLPWSSGQAEGPINRLRMLKPAMYGPVQLDLLRRRFLLVTRSTKLDEDRPRGGRSPLRER